MGATVGATLCTHIPRLIMPEEKRKKYLQNVNTTFLDALPDMYEQKIKALDFDTFVVFDTHWHALIDFIIDGREHHKGLYTSEEVPHMISDYSFDYPGDSDLANVVAETAEKSGLRVRIARQQSLPYHYPTLVPMHFLNPNGKHRVLPMGNMFSTSAQNELDFGKAVGRAIEKSNRRVVLVASGGLSHKFHSYDTILDKASPELKNISGKNRKMDEMVIDLLKNGRHRNMWGIMKKFRQYCSPEGRFTHYIRMLGALGGIDCEIPAVQFGKYEAAVGTGQVNLWFDVPH